MALQLGALRDALLDAGASPEKAEKATEELAAYENRLGGIETKIEQLNGKLTLVHWMVGFNMAIASSSGWSMPNNTDDVGC
jgi:hypothetical protein